jgi:predicted transposase YdaD
MGDVMNMTTEQNLSAWAMKHRMEGRLESEARGEARGELKGRHELLLLQLAERFGERALKNGLSDRILAADIEQVNDWAKRILTAKSVNDIFFD